MAGARSVTRAVDPVKPATAGVVTAGVTRLAPLQNDSGVLGAPGLAAIISFIPYRNTVSSTTCKRRGARRCAPTKQHSGETNRVENYRWTFHRGFLRGLRR
jgi:hypothetical protein